jgi:hypothetical protein
MTIAYRSGILLLLPLLLLGVSAAARQSDQAAASKMDTTTADTVVVGANAPATSSDLAPADTSVLSGAGETSATSLPDSVIFRSVPDSLIDAWKRNRRFAYANDPAYWHRQREEPSPFLQWLGRFLSSTGFRYFVYIVLGGLLVFAILRIMFENNLGLFYRNRAKKVVRGGGAQNEVAEEEDLDERLQYYLNQNDHRQAVRYLYLRSLRALGERGLIQGDGRSTNREYLRQLSGTPQEAPFRFLTGAYEKVWYGEFDLGDEAFRRLHRYFEDFDKNIGA